MNFIFIYGPPAAGKLTVGGELAVQTGYRFFHSQLTRPAAQAIFPSHEPHPDAKCSSLVKKLRLTAIEAAAEAGVNTIFTLAYSGKVDDLFVSNIVEAVNSHGGKVHFVQLHAPDEVLLQRVGNESRRVINKLSDPERLRQLLEIRDMHDTVKYPDVLQLDTSRLEPIAAAQQIMDNFGLQYGKS